MKILVRVCDRRHTHCVFMSTSSKIPQFVTCVQAYVEYTIRLFLLPVACLNYCVVQYSSFQMTMSYKFHVQQWHILMLHCPLEKSQNLSFYRSNQFLQLQSLQTFHSFSSFQFQFPTFVEGRESMMKQSRSGDFCKSRKQTFPD